jgi:hypothetical protein
LFDALGDDVRMYGTALPVTPSERLAAIVAGLLNAVGKQSTRPGLLWLIGGLIGGKIMRVRNLALALIARIEQGTLRRSPVRQGPVSPQKPLDEAARQRLLEAAAKWRKVPRKAGWLVALVGYEAAGFASQLSHLLQDEEMKRHLAASPRLGRALWPLCKMLGMDPALLGFSPVERKQRRIVAESGAVGAGTGRHRRSGQVMGRPAGTHPTIVTDAAAWKEPSRAAIMREINTRRWPSIEMQARPERYRWYPMEPAGPGDTDEKSG